MTLQLEYICTEAEMKEAQSLNFQRQFGGGSKWRSLLLYWAFIIVVVGLLFLRFKIEVAPKDRVWFIPMTVILTVLILIALQYYKRITRQKRDQTVRVELSEQELILIGSNGRSAIPWSAFRQCLESPALFVLLDKPRRILFAIPKRAFPDEISQDWFRTLAKQLGNSTTSPSDQASIPGRIAGKGVSITMQWGYRDFLVRTFTSWRSKGVALGMTGLFLGIFLFTPQPEHAVMSRGQVLLISLGTMVPILTVGFFVMTLISWRSQKKFHEPQQLAVSSDGIQFVSRDGSGLLAWSTYKYYLENRWAFFIWNPQGSQWMMLPKREFASPMDVELCRELLRTHLKPSRWFFF